MDSIENRRLFQLALATDFRTFFERAFRDVDQRNQLISAAYIELVIEMLDRVTAGKATRVIINLPPRHLKSIMISIVFPAWLLGQDPRRRIGVISHSQALARDMALRSHRLVESEWYREAFPKTRLSKDRNQATDFETTEGGGRYASSFDTGITGRGFDLIIVDDPISAHDVRSAAERERVIEAYDTMIASRLDPNGLGAIIGVGQRLHEDDLWGHLLAAARRWTHIELPLIATVRTEHRIGDRLWIRERGEVLIPALWPPPVVERVRTDVRESIFQTQYQQNPLAAAGELINPANIHYFEKLPPAANRITLSWDTAVKTGSGASYTVCLVIAQDGKRHYVIDVLRERLDPVQTREAALRLIRDYQPAKILIEDASSGPGLAKMLEDNGHRPELWPTGGRGKEERLESRLHMFVEGRVLVRDEQPWTIELVNEWVRFPFAKHDDQMDAMTQYLDWVASNPPRPKAVWTLGGSDTPTVRGPSRDSKSPVYGPHGLRPRPGQLRPRIPGRRRRR
jgi:predicted phage terminase large subunit-like protein